VLIGQLTILAPGLLGASVGMAAKSKGVADRVVVWARRAETRQGLSGQPWCDEVADEMIPAVRSAAVIVIAAPVDAIIPLTRQIAPHLANGAVATDVGSVKSRIARDCHAAVAEGGRAGVRAHFVGAHPMAGSEKTGWEHGSAMLFDGRTCFVTPMAETDPAAAAHVAAFWEALGMNVATVSPEAHDRIVAHISHLPQVLASALCGFLAGQDDRWRGYAGGGLRDTTRIAASDPVLWRAILEANRDHVLEAVAGLKNELEGFEEDLIRGDWASLTARMSRAKAYRDGFKR
jgi:prephenate dehydrogenase